MALIQVTPDLLNSKANDLRTLKGQHDEAMSKMRTLIMGLNEVWKGDAQDAFVAKYESMQSTFNNFSQMLEDYAKLMNTAAQKLQETYPGLKIAGTHDGYFKEDGPVVEAINAAHPDALLVCLGAPKQEYFMEEHDADLEVPVMAGLGGSMDVLAGNVQRAPEFYQKHGLEWLYRLVKEPQRWRRMIKLPLYLLDAVAWKIKGGK